MSRIRNLGTYQMLWDCSFCGTKKLLGNDHRFCPNCGASQDPEARYFPSDAEKVATEDHVFHGADLICEACSTPNSAASNYCQQCGSSLADAPAAATLGIESRATNEVFQQGVRRDPAAEQIQQLEATPKKSRMGLYLNIAIGVMVIILIGLILAVLFFWNRSTTAVVTGHEWERTINVERFQAVEASEWCDDLPREAYSVSRREEVRSYRDVPDGETCRVEREDLGDGNFREREVCETDYRSEPVYDEKCYYTINLWQKVREEESSGSALTDTPYWPEANLARTGNCLGCERIGGRDEDYTVFFQEDGGGGFNCEFDNVERWRQFTLGSSWSLEMGVLIGTPRCSTLSPISE